MGRFETPPIEESQKQWGESDKSEVFSGELLHIFIWNIYKGKRDALYSDLETMSLQSDFVMIQEGKIYDEPSTKFYEKHPSWFYDFAVSFFYKKSGQATGVLNFTKYTPLYSKIYRTEHREPIVGTPKMSLIQKFAIKGSNKTLMLINIHGINRTNTKKLGAQLLPLFDEIEKHSGPVIFGGDFNTRNKSRTKLLSEMAEKQGMQWLKLKGDNRRKKLDHVLVRDLKVESAVLHTHFGSSDHPAISVYFRL